MLESKTLQEAARNFADNPEPRCACLLLLDTSASMQGIPINSLNKGLQSFKEALMKNNLARLRVEIAIITFDHEVRVVQDFEDPEHFSPPSLDALGSATNMAAAIQKGLDMIQARKIIYRTYGIPYFRPWLFLITDGCSTEDDFVIKQTAQRVKDEEHDKRIVCYAVGVQGADMMELGKIVSDPLPLKDLNFEELFKWVSASLGEVSNSKPKQSDLTG